MRPPVAVDVLLAALVTVLGLVSLAVSDAPDRRGADAVGVLLVLLGSLPVAARSRWPIVALAVSLPSSLAVFAMGYSQTNGGLGALLCLYSVAALLPPRISAAAAAGTALTVSAVLPLAPVEGVSVVDVVANLLAVALFWGAGAWSRSRRKYVRGLEERNEALLAARESQARAALVEARGAVAREMQDVVGHSVMAMTVQAAAARRLVLRDPAAAEGALGEVEELGRSAVQEIRRVLGLLGDADDATVTRPQPGLADIRDLVDSCRRDGLDVRLEESGPEIAVEPGAALTAYRVVEEALRNVAQHAGPARVVVTLNRDDSRVEVGVADDGRGVPSWRARESASAKGLGMLSLSRRVESYGGSLTAGPRAGGGFVVTAAIPTAVSRQKVRLS